MIEFPLPSFAPTFGGVAALYLLYYVHWELTVGASRRRMIREHGCQKPVPLPDWDPIFGLGNIVTILRWSKARQLLANGRKRFEALPTTTFATNSLGSKFLFTIEPENLKHIQSVQFKNFAMPDRRKKAFVELLGHGIFNTDGAAWQHSRDMLRPNFVRSQVGDLDTYEQHVDHLIAALPRDGATEVDLQPLFFKLTMDSATELLFGESTNTLVPKHVSPGALEFARAFQESQDRALDHARFGFLSTIVPDAKYKRNVQFIHAFLDSLVERAAARHAAGKTQASPERYVFADELLTRTSDRAQIRGELLNILLAGRDTTASLLSNVWFELAKRPDIFTKLRAEIDELLPGGMAPTYEQIKSAKYLRALLNESLRLYPVVPGNARQALVDTVLPKGGGRDGQAPMFVAKGNIVGWSLYTMHRREALYGADSTEFRPERWLGENGLRVGWEYLPFNGGPRICLGRMHSVSPNVVAG